MQVVLLERVEKLGQIGDVVNVKPGFARNFLLPQNKALRATDDNIAYFNAQKETLLAANAQRRSEAETQAKKLAGQKFVLLRNASEVGMLFGSVGARDVVEAAAEAGFTIPRANIKLDQGIKTLGVFNITVAPHPEVLIQVTVNIARSKEEAAEQFKTGQMYVRKPDEEQAPRRNSRRSKAEDAAPAAEGEQTEAEAPAETA
jgi:large subunit ribosomal protein L9